MGASSAAAKIMLRGHRKRAVEREAPRPFEGATFAAEQQRDRGGAVYGFFRAATYAATSSASSILTGFIDFSPL